MLLERSISFYSVIKDHLPTAIFLSSEPLKFAPRGFQICLIFIIQILTGSEPNKKVPFQRLGRKWGGGGGIHIKYGMSKILHPSTLTECKISLT